MFRHDKWCLDFKSIIAEQSNIMAIFYRRITYFWQKHTVQITVQNFNFMVMISFYSVLGCHETSQLSSFTSGLRSFGFRSRTLISQHQNIFPHSAASREDNECNYSGSEWSSPLQRGENQWGCVSGKVQLPTEAEPQPSLTILLTHTTGKALSTHGGLVTITTADCSLLGKGKSNAQLNVTCPHRCFVPYNTRSMHYINVSDGFCSDCRIQMSDTTTVIACNVVRQTIIELEHFKHSF